VHLVELKAAGFRNLAPEAVRWCPGRNLLLGDNGQGKTNVLEAVAVLGNLRSFRTPSLRRVVSHGAAEFDLEGQLESGGELIRLSQRVTCGPPLSRELRIAGVKAPVERYLRLFPLVALTRDDGELVTGEPAHRRAFLDRFAFLLEPVHFEQLRSYRRVLRQRNAGLGAGLGESEIEIWEPMLAAAAAAIIDRRRRACRRLRSSFRSIYDELRPGGFPEISLVYRGESGLDEAEKVPELELFYRKRYNETRPRDRRVGFTGDGPHRHDVGLRADDRTVRHTLSSGQTKVVAAALRFASLQQVERERDELLPVIIDDVDAELDATVLGNMIRHLGGHRQLFLSSADEAVARRLGAGSCRFLVTGGRITETAGDAGND
jgi:DNA replication and repair protein RecF